MTLKSAFFLFAICSLLLLACSSRDTAKAEPTPPEPTGTTAEEPDPKESPATGTTLTRDGVQPTQPDGELITNGQKEQPSGTSTPTSTGTIRTTLSDNELATTVKDMLEESDPSAASSIEVLAKEGVVTLKGNVSSQEEVDRIIVMVKTVPNVKEVVSKLTIANQ